MKIYKILSVFLIVFLLTGTFSFGQEKKQKSKITVSADNTSIPWGENNKNITLRGNVSIIHEDIKILSAYVIFNQETKYAQSPGKVTVNSKKTYFTSDKGEADFKKKICNAKGNIKGYIKKENINEIKNKTKKDNIKKEITENINFECDEAEYNYRTKILNAKGNIKITEKDRIITCNELKYDSNEEIFYLNGNVIGSDSKNQSFRSDGEVIVSVKDGNEYVKAPKVESVFYIDPDDE